MNLRSKLLLSSLSFGTVFGGFGLATMASPASAALPHPVEIQKPPSIVKVPPQIEINPCLLNPSAPGCGPVIEIPDIPVIPIDPCILNPSKPGCGPTITIPNVPDDFPCIVNPDICTDDIGEDEPETPGDATPTDDVDRPVKGRPTFTG